MKFLKGLLCLVDLYESSYQLLKTAEDDYVCVYFPNFFSYLYAYHSIFISNL